MSTNRTKKFIDHSVTSITCSMVNIFFFIRNHHLLQFIELINCIGLNHTSELNITYLFQNQKTLGSRDIIFCLVLILLFIFSSWTFFLSCMNH